MIELPSSPDPRAAPLSERPEPELIELARTRDAEAIAELVRRHQGRVRAFVASHLRRAELVDDVSQEVFLTAYRRLDTYRGPAPFVSWVLGIARTRILECLRAEIRVHQRHRRLADAALIEARTVLLDEAAEPDGSEAAVRSLRACLAALPAPSGALVQDYYFASLTLGDLATRHGKTVGALRMLLFRIRQDLRACVQRRLAREAT